ncbi:ornithine cyclodeaminase family protein [Rothia kristinae]
MPAQPSASIRHVGADQVSAHLPMRAAVDALRQSLLDGLDPAEDLQRCAAPLTRGRFLMMPSEVGGYAGIKILTLCPDNAERELPTIQGAYLLHDAETLSPLAMIDGTALTAVRTPAVSALGVDLLAEREARELLVFGTGPQALQHVHAIAAVRQISRVGLVGRDLARTRAAVERLRRDGYRVHVAHADDVAGAPIIACCTASPEPLFDGAAVDERAVVVAMGSHTPDAREVDDALLARARVYVEDPKAALREAGEIVQGAASGILSPERLRPLRELVCSPGPQDAPDAPGPALFKTVGMGWQDLVTARALYENLPGRG